MPFFLQSLIPVAEVCPEMETRVQPVDDLFLFSFEGAQLTAERAWQIRHLENFRSARGSWQRTLEETDSALQLQPNLQTDSYSRPKTSQNKVVP